MLRLVSFDGVNINFLDVLFRHNLLTGKSMAETQLFGFPLIFVLLSFKSADHFPNQMQGIARSAQRSIAKQNVNCLVWRPKNCFIAHVRKIGHKQYKCKTKVQPMTHM